jgi:hypothetical protein
MIYHLLSHATIDWRPCDAHTSLLHVPIQSLRKANTDVHVFLLLCSCYYTARHYACRITSPRDTYFLLIYVMRNPLSLEVYEYQYTYSNASVPVCTCHYKEPLGFRSLRILSPFNVLNRL